MPPDYLHNVKDFDILFGPSCVAAAEIAEVLFLLIVNSGLRNSPMGVLGVDEEVPRQSEWSRPCTQHVRGRAVVSSLAVK